MANNWLNLEEKVCVVTGALGGMGSKICEEFASQGAYVVLVDLMLEKAKEYAKELSEKYNVKTLAVEVNPIKIRAIAVASNFIFVSLAFSPETSEFNFGNFKNKIKSPSSAIKIPATQKSVV